ncbi:MAG: hypothetical protein RR549_02930 [Oscillospiraceae bacterium]
MSNNLFLEEIEKDEYKIIVNEGYGVLSFFNVPSSLEFMEDILNSLAKNSIIVDMISMTPPCSDFVRVAISIKDDDIVCASKAISSLKNKYPYLKPVISIGNVKISIKSNDMETKCGVAARAFTALLRENCEIFLITTAQNEISFIMPIANAHECEISLKKYFKLL